MDKDDTEKFISEDGEQTEQNLPECETCDWSEEKVDTKIKVEWNDAYSIPINSENKFKNFVVLSLRILFVSLIVFYLLYVVKEQILSFLWFLLRFFRINF